MGIVAASLIFAGFIVGFSGIFFVLLNDVSKQLSRIAAVMEILERRTRK